MSGLQLRSRNVAVAGVLLFFYNNQERGYMKYGKTRTTMEKKSLPWVPEGPIRRCKSGKAEPGRVHGQPRIVYVGGEVYRACSRSYCSFSHVSIV